MGIGQRRGRRGRHLRLQRRARVLGWQQHPLASLLLLLRKVGRRIGTGRRRPCWLLRPSREPSPPGRLVASLRCSRRRIVLLLKCSLLPPPGSTPFVASSNSPRRLALLRESCLPPSLVVLIPSSTSRVPQKIRPGIRQGCRGQRGTKNCGWSRVARFQGRALVCMAVCRWHG